MQFVLLDLGWWFLLRRERRLMNSGHPIAQAVSGYADFSDAQGTLTRDIMTLGSNN